MTDEAQAIRDFNPFAHLKAAAMGNIEAQRRLADAAVEMARAALESGPEYDPMPYLVDGLLFARLAAAHGDTGDKGRLISMLALASSLCGHPESKTDYDAEALAVIEILADEGNDIANDLMPSVAEQATPEAMQLAHEFKERMTA